MGSGARLWGATAEYKTRYKSRSPTSKLASFIKLKAERRQYPPNCAKHQIVRPGDIGKQNVPKTDDDLIARGGIQ